MNNTENKGEIQICAFLSQIDECVKKGFYYVAIMASLVIPDIGGAIDSDNGSANKTKYAGWFNKYVQPRYIGDLKLTGDECFYLRCSMLHQGKTKHDADKIKVAFTNFPQVIPPVTPLFRHNSLGLLIDPRTFCYNMIYGAYCWLEVVHDDDCFKKNIENFISFYSLSFTFM